MTQCKRAVDGAATIWWFWLCVQTEGMYDFIWQGKHEKGNAATSLLPEMVMPDGCLMV